MLELLYHKRNPLLQLLHITVGRVVLTPLFYEDPLILPTPPPFSNFVQPPPYNLQPPHPLLFLLSCSLDWMGDCTTFNVLFYLKLVSAIFHCFKKKNVFLRYFEQSTLNRNLTWNCFFFPIVSWTFILAWATMHCPPS